MILRVHWHPVIAVAGGLELQIYPHQEIENCIDFPGKNYDSEGSLESGIRGGWPTGALDPPPLGD